MPKEKMTDKEAERALKRGAKKVRENDLKKVLDKKQKIEDKFKAYGPLDDFISDLKILFSLIKDYKNGKYREIPWWSIAAIASALLYVLSPIDMIPDFIPFVGYVDDAMVVSACLKLVKQDLNKYEEWKAKNV